VDRADAAPDVSPPRHLWIGLGLIAIAWPLNWLLRGPRTHLLFFPLWLGYCLAVDGLVYCRKGSSLLTRNRRAYVGLFLVSAPVWWLFEALNLRTQNWLYDGRELFSDATYAMLATLSFSTVIPAVFGTAELVSTFRWLRRLGRGPILKPTRGLTIGVFAAGWVMLGLLLAWPRVFFPFLWTITYCLVAPVNIWLGNRSLADETAEGNWHPVLALWTGVLITAFFWEMWNYFSYPRWVYSVPLVDFLHIFEMPALGYLGYIPFSLELFAVYHFVVGVLGAGHLRDYVELERRAG
jgi:hypothetical protein